MRTPRKIVCISCSAPCRATLSIELRYSVDGRLPHHLWSLRGDQLWLSHGKRPKYSGHRAICAQKTRPCVRTLIMQLRTLRNVLKRKPTCVFLVCSVASDFPKGIRRLPTDAIFTWGDSRGRRSQSLVHRRKCPRRNGRKPFLRRGGRRDESSVRLDSIDCTQTMAATFARGSPLELSLIHI